MDKLKIWIKGKLKKISSTAANNIDSLLLIPGTIFVSYGIFLIYVPAGFIAIGTFLIAIALIVAKKASIKK